MKIKLTLAKTTNFRTIKINSRIINTAKKPLKLAETYALALDRFGDGFEVEMDKANSAVVRITDAGLSTNYLVSAEMA